MNFLKRLFVGTVTFHFFTLPFMALAQETGVYVSVPSHYQQQKFSVEEYVQQFIEKTYRRLVDEVVREMVVQLRLTFPPPVFQQIQIQLFTQGINHPVIREAFRIAQSQGYQICVEQHQMGTNAKEINQLLSVNVSRLIQNTSVKRATQQVAKEILKQIVGP